MIFFYIYIKKNVFFQKKSFFLHFFIIFESQTQAFFVKITI